MLYFQLHSFRKHQNDNEFTTSASQHDRFRAASGLYLVIFSSTIIVNIWLLTLYTHRDDHRINDNGVFTWWLLNTYDYIVLWETHFCVLLITAAAGPCVPNPCLNGGLCQSVNGVFQSCNCMPGFCGTNCECVLNAVTNSCICPIGTCFRYMMLKTYKAF